MTPRSTGPAAAGRTTWLGIALVAALLVPGVVMAASWNPQLRGSAGGSFAVLGTPDDGGTSVSLAAMWPVSPRLAFGVMVHGDDAGSTVDSLRDEQGHGLAYGRVEQLHRMAWGASWRLDATGPARFGATPFASATLGYYRISNDLRGRELGSFGSAGFSLGAGARWPLGRHFALGASIRYHRLFNDVEGRFVNAGLDCAWH